MASLWLKGGRFSEIANLFSNFQTSKKIFQIIILNLKFGIPAYKSKQLIQDSDLEWFFFEIWRFEKRISLSEKKPPLAEVVKLFGRTFEQKTIFHTVALNKHDITNMCNSYT